MVGGALGAMGSVAAARCVPMEPSAVIAAAWRRRLQRARGICRDDNAAQRWREPEAGEGRWFRRARAMKSRWLLLGADTDRLV